MGFLDFFKSKNKSVDELIMAVPIKTLRDKLISIEDSLKIIRGIKNRLKWGHSLQANIEQFMVSNNGDFNKLMELHKLMVKTLDFLNGVINDAKVRSSYNLPQDLILYFDIAATSLERDISLLNSRIPKGRRSVAA